MATMCKRFVFVGEVQGVGFRMAAVQMGRDLELSGTVKNMADGSVELVLVGEAKEMDVLVGRLREQFGSLIRNVTEAASAVAGRLRPGVHVAY